MKVLITGAGGQLGRDLQDVLIEKGIEFVGVERETITDHIPLDITDFSATREFVIEHKFTHIINCASFNWVDKAEDNMRLAYELNALSARNLAQICNELGVILVHYSTNYVFDGNSQRPYMIFDKSNSNLVFGQSKAAGEEAVRELAYRHFTIRTSWVFGVGNTNFIKKIIDWSKESNVLAVIDDEIANPTYTRDLAEATLKLMKTRAYGLYHITNKGYCSRYEWAKFALEQIGWKGTITRSTQLEQKLNPVRPRFAPLDPMGLKEIIGTEMPDWQDATVRFIAQMRDMDLI